jgi:hypothetical protein
MWSAIDEVMYVVNNTTFSMKDGLTQFNDGSNGGIPNVQPLADALSAVQKDINNLKTAFAGWTPAPNDGGAALKTSLTANYPTAPLAVTTKTDIEDTTVTH